MGEGINNLKYGDFEPLNVSLAVSQKTNLFTCFLLSCNNVIFDWLPGKILVQYQSIVSFHRNIKIIMTPVLHFLVSIREY